MEQRTTVSKDLSTLYPIARDERVPLTLGTHTTLRARWTGEKRAPRAGEWYLSGAIVEAWYASNDLTQEFHIAEAVTGALVTVWIENPQQPGS